MNIERNNSMNASWGLERMVLIFSFLVLRSSKRQLVLRWNSLGVRSCDSGLLRRFLGAHELRMRVSVRITEKQKQKNDIRA